MCTGSFTHTGKQSVSRMWSIHGNDNLSVPRAKPGRCKKGSFNNCRFNKHFANVPSVSRTITIQGLYV